MNFHERFKGKTSLMTKNGPAELLSQVQSSIPKQKEPTKPINISSSSSKPLKLPLQTYNPKFPSAETKFPSPGTKHPSLKECPPNPFLVQNPYVPGVRSNRNPEDWENQDSKSNLNNFQAHYLRSSPSYKVVSSKDILLSNSKNVMMDSPNDQGKNNQQRPPSLDSMNPKMLQVNRKANTAFEMKYKPYTYKDYAEIQRTACSTLQKGLGPNINTEDWLAKKEKLEKMSNFSQYVKLFNSKKITENPKVENDSNKRENEERLIAKLNREKALEFAKNVPKPVIPKSKKHCGINNNEIEVEKNEFKDELQILEQQHLKLLNDIENMNAKRK